MAVLEAVVDFLHAVPVNVTALFGGFQPGQLRVGFDHGVDGLGDGLLVDVLDVDVQAFHRFDGDFALGDHLGLQQGFVGGALAFGGGPYQAVAALLVALLIQILHRLEGDATAALQCQVGAAVQPRALVQLVAGAGQGQVAAGGDLGADMADGGDFVTLCFLAAPAALFLLVVQRIVGVLVGDQRQLLAGVEVSLVAGLELAGGEDEIAVCLCLQVAAGFDDRGHLLDVVLLGDNLLAAALAVVIGVVLVG
ncbi:hypothetical protein SRABI70_01487 [Pseudomonas sp. Bi70]|nr:hypothetical protein SRABI70_01487 [Pseudomonas sp. Bi70]